MKVMKFGGTSVGSVNSILSVKKIVEAVNEPVIIVVSALGGITDKLINTSRMAASGDAAYENDFREIVYRHVEMIKEVIPAGEAQVALQRQVGELLNELKDIFQGIYLIKDLSQKTSDTIVSYGERLSSLIAAQLTGAEWLDSRQFIKTEKKHSKHVLDTDLTNELVRKAFANCSSRVLVPGFIATDKVTGDVTNLGRGGSDYTAAIIAAALDADSLEIWTDVDGFMTADPRVISTAYTINELSYVEAMELCNFGAKVVYPPTIYPVCHKNIPILIKNTFNPEGVGTVIKQEVSSPQSKPIKGISSINDTSLITVQGLGMAFERYFLKDKSTYKEEKGNYFKLRNNEEECDAILDAFGVSGQNRHIINGHVPVHVVNGENPIKANGKLMVIDGGFSQAYHEETGIAGYTLVYHSRGFQLVQHEPFTSTEDAILRGSDIKSTTQIVEMSSHRMLVADTDIGRDLKKQIAELEKLLYAYRHGFIKELR